MPKIITELNNPKLKLINKHKKKQKKIIFWTIQNIFFIKQIGIVNNKKKKIFNIVKKKNLKNNHFHENELLKLE